MPGSTDVIPLSRRPFTGLGIGDRDRHLALLLLLILVGAALATDLPLPVAVALMLVAVGASAVSPIAATAAVAASTPLVYHPVALGNSQFSLLELALIVGSAGLAVQLLLALSSRRLIDTFRILIGNWPTTIAATILVVLGALSILTLADPRHRPESLRELRVVIIEPIAALVLTRWSLRHRGGGVLVIGLVGAGLVVATVAVLQIVTGQGEVIGNGVGRATGPYPHPNNLAFYLERVGLFAAAIALVDRRVRRIALPVVVVLAAGIVATLSRGALLAVIAGVALLFGIVRPDRGWRLLAAAAILSVGGFALAAGDRLFSTGASGATSSRELIWRSSLEMAGDHPVFGVGLDQFLYQYAPRYVAPAGWPERYTSHPHNLILDFWLSLGLAGVFLLIGVAVLSTMRILLLRHGEARSQHWILAVAGAVMLAGGAAHGLVDNGFFLPDLAVLTWIAIALIEQPAAESPP